MINETLVLVGMPLTPAHQSDTRIISMLERWDRQDDVETFYVPSPHTTLGRDRIVKYAMYRRPRPSHILFVDHDVLPRFNTLKRLLAHDKDVVSGVYPMMRNSKIEWCLSREDPFVPLDIWDLPDNPFKAKYVGCGMMLVKIEVFDKLSWPYWEDGFAPGIKTIGEDVFFCKKLREFGYDIWIDPKVKCNHFRLVDLLIIAMDYTKGKKQGEKQ